MGREVQDYFKEEVNKYLNRLLLGRKVRNSSGDEGVIQDVDVIRGLDIKYGWGNQRTPLDSRFVEFIDEPPALPKKR